MCISNQRNTRMYISQHTLLLDMVCNVFCGKLQIRAVRLQERRLQIRALNKLNVRLHAEICPRACSSILSKHKANHPSILPYSPCKSFNSGGDDDGGLHSGSTIAISSEKTYLSCSISPVSILLLAALVLSHCVPTGLASDMSLADGCPSSLMFPCALSPCG